jgi:hypothetical protein
MTGAGAFDLDTNSYLTSLSGAMLTDQTAPQTLGSADYPAARAHLTDLDVANPIAGSVTGNACTVTNATLTTALTVNTGAVTLAGNVAGSTLTLGAGASSVSGSNAGDETATTIKEKLGAASASTDGYLSQADWSTFNGKSILGLGETSGTAYRGDHGKAAYDHSQIATGNPHGTLAADVHADAIGTASTAVATHAALRTGVHGLAITAGKTLTVQNDVTITGSLGTAAYTAASAYEASGAVATHAGLKTGVHGLAIRAGQTLTVTSGGTLGTAA